MGEGDLFERSVDRRELLKKVAVYTPPLVLGGTLVNAGVALAAGSESPISSETSSSSSGSTSVPSEGSTSLPSSTSSGSSSGHSYQDPLALLQADLAALIAIPSTGNPGEDKKVAQAVGFLTEATQSSRWVDDYTLDASTGDATFYDLKWAADALHASSNSSASTLVSDVVVAAGTIANYAYDHASLSAKTDRQVQRKLATAGSRSAGGNVRGAIAAYMHAWDLVVRGSESPDSDD